MKDKKKRPPGKYKEHFVKMVDGVFHEMIEEYTIGKNHKVKSYSTEYKPPIPAQITWDEM